MDLADDERRRFPTTARVQARCKTPLVGPMPFRVGCPLLGKAKNEMDGSVLWSAPC